MLYCYYLAVYDLGGVINVYNSIQTGTQDTQAHADTSSQSRIYQPAARTFRPAFSH